MNLPSNPSATLKRLNPHLYPLAGLPNTQRQQDQRSKSQDSELAKGQAGVAYRITIVSLRSKLVDAHDNIRMGAKPLVDQITATLGFQSDDNPYLSWRYVQAISDGARGTIVVIEPITAKGKPGSCVQEPG